MWIVVRLDRKKRKSQFYETLHDFLQRGVKIGFAVFSRNNFFLCLRMRGKAQKRVWCTVFFNIVYNFKNAKICKIIAEARKKEKELFKTSFTTRGTENMHLRYTKPVNFVKNALYDVALVYVYFICYFFSTRILKFCIKNCCSVLLY